MIAKGSARLLLSIGLLASLTFAALEDVAFCGDCFCIPEPGAPCPTLDMPQVEFSQETLNNFRGMSLLNPITLSCDPFTDGSCDTFPPLQEGEVCTALISGPIGGGQCPEEYTYFLVTESTREFAEQTNRYITHEGPCGVCSSFQDLAAYMENPDLASIGIQCGPTVLGDLSAGVACFMAEAGFTEPCATLWAYNVIQTNANCILPCATHAFSGLPNNGPPPTCEPVECIQCDEENSGPVFQAFAGRTRRRSGLLSAIVRPCGSLADVTDLDPCEYNINRAICESVIDLEQDLGVEFGTVCECSTQNDTSALLSCTDQLCLGCNTAGDVCARFSFGATFGGDFAAFSEVNYISGLSDVVRYEETINECTVSVNGDACTSCTFSNCTDGSEGIDINCTNIPSAPDFYSSCDPAAFADGPFQVFNANEFGECVSPGEMRCFMARNSIEQFGQMLGSRCECLVEGQAVTTVCSDTTCEFCNTDGSVCTQTTYGTVYDRSSGESIGSAGSARYVSGGRSEAVTVTETGDTCLVAVDGVNCTSCDPIICMDSMFGQLSADIVCSNVPDGSDYNSCTPTDTDGVLQIFNQNEFEVCVPRATSFVEDICVAEAAQITTDCACVESDVPESTITGGRFDLGCNRDDVCYSCPAGSIPGGDVCTSHSSITSYDPPLGGISTIQDLIVYSKGRDDEVRLVLDSCIGSGDPCPFDYTCMMEVNGVACSSCDLCGEFQGGFGIEGVTPAVSFNCSNIESDAIYDLCVDTPGVVEQGIFRFLSNETCPDSTCGGVGAPCGNDGSKCCSGRCFQGTCRGSFRTGGKLDRKIGKGRGGAAGRQTRRGVRGL